MLEHSSAALSWQTDQYIKKKKKQIGKLPVIACTSRQDYKDAIDRRLHTYINTEFLYK